MAQYVFLDECGVATDLLRRYGRSPGGTRLRDHAPFGHWETASLRRYENCSLVVAERLRGLNAPDPDCRRHRGTRTCHADN
jgi:hypothetical protein